MRNYTIQDGLPSNTVYCVYKDSKGTLWFGTDKGIARYNGVRFEKFSTADGLPDNEIFSFGEDKYNRLWMGTYNSSLCYYKDGIIHTAANTPFLKLPAKFSFITNICNEYDGSVTLFFSASGYFVNIVGEKVHLYNITSLTDERRWYPLQIIKKSPTQYEITYSGFVYNWDTSGKAVLKEMPDTLAYGLVSNNKRYLTSVTQFAYDNVYHEGQFVCHIPDYAGIKVEGVLEDKERRQVLLCTSKGLFIMPQNKALFKGHVVSYASKDMAGNYWITTTDEGVFCLNADYTQFGAFKNTDNSPVTYARIVNHQLYFATRNRNLYTLKHDTIKKLFDGYAFKDNYIRDHPTYNTYYVDGEFAELMTKQKRHIYEYLGAPPAYYLDTNLCFYYFSPWDNLMLDQLSTGKAHVATYLPMHTTNTYKNIAVTNDGIYLEIYHNIVYVPSAVLKDLDCRQIQLLKPNSGKNPRFFGWAKDQTENLWISTVDSLYKVVKDKLIVQPEYGAIGLRKFNLLNGFLIGYTHDNKLRISHHEHQQVITDTTINGSSIWGNFYQIDNSHLIISSSDKYYMATLTAPGRKNGFRINAIESRFLPQQAEYICADSTACYFFKDGTITRFDTKRLFDVSTKPILHFVSLTTLKNTYATTDPLVNIPYNEGGDLQLSYLPISFSGGDLQCQYSISNDSSKYNWHNIDETNIHLYLNHYGTYYVRVRAKASSDIYSDIATLQLTIAQPFWASWWFITLIVIISLAIIWLIIIAITRSILRRRQKDYEADMKYQRMEFKALNALMNPHFIFNTLNNIQNLFKNQQHKADEYFVTFARLIRQNMQNVTKDTVSLEQELNLVANYLKLEKLRFGEFVNYTMDVDPELDLDNVFIPPLLIQPLVENSIRHGLLPKESPDNKVIVRVFEKGKSLFVEVEDNGVGLTYKTSHIDPQHESLGLSNLRKRIEHMNRAHNISIIFNLTEIKDELDKIKGTIARIEITSLRW